MVKFDRAWFVTWYNYADEIKEMITESCNKKIGPLWSEVPAEQVNFNRQRAHNIAWMMGKIHEDLKELNFEEVIKTLVGLAKQSEDLSQFCSIYGKYETRLKKYEDRFKQLSLDASILLENFKNIKRIIKDK